MEVNASGPTRVLLVSDSRSCSPPLSRGQRELEGCVELPALGISVVDEAPQELCYISLRRISLDVLRNSIDKSVDLRVGAVQVDNSLPATAFPVLFATQAPAEKDAMPAVHVSLCKGNAYSEMSYYRYLGFAVQPCTVKFDERTRFTWAFAHPPPAVFVLASVNFASALYDLMGEYWKAQDFEQYANNSAKLGTACELVCRTPRPLTRHSGPSVPDGAAHLLRRAGDPGAARAGDVPHAPAPVGGRRRLGALPVDRAPALARGPPR